jgi:atypical dual specificity phosphatase
MKELKAILPDYPRTRHVPWKANAARGDLVATAEEAAILLQSPNISVEEKIDGANCGMALYHGEAVIRNHNHVLRKGYMKDTPAKRQFVHVWNWFYENKGRFELLNELEGSVAVYGEWMVAQHGLEYDQLPSLFVAYDLYDYESHKFIASNKARNLLITAGFQVVPQLHYGPLTDFQLLETLANQPSPFTTKGNREGVYLKVSDDQWITDRFKMVREGFNQGGLWDEDNLKKNKLK